MMSNLKNLIEGQTDDCKTKFITNGHNDKLDEKTNVKENRHQELVTSGCSNGISSSSSGSSSSSSSTSTSTSDVNGRINGCCCNCSNSNGSCNSVSEKKRININDLRDLLFMSHNQQFTTNNFKSDKNYIDLYGHNYDDEWDQIYSFPRLFLNNNTNENQLEPFVLQPSLFQRNHVPPTVYFNTKLSDESRPPIGLPKYLNIYFKWKISNITPNSIRNCISFMKFEVIKPSNKNETKYLGSWYKHMLTAEFSQLEEWRKVNHYPGSFHLGRKDKLWFKLRNANLKYGTEKFGNFQPLTFVLPRDYEELCEYWKSSPTKLFIIKPPASARGNGIKVINDISQIPTSAFQSTTILTSNDDDDQQQQTTSLKKSTMIVQQYISNPCLLENGQKFDLRVYVLLTSIDPLRIYVYNEGLVRFASTKYTCQEDGIIDQYMHLTNYFINKNNQEYQINNDCESLDGCKWTLKRFWRYLKEHHTNIDSHQLWSRIIDIIIKTIISCEVPITRLSRQNCKNDYTSYELFGFDIILDENFKPWILEVNITPSLKSESNLDTSVKYGVIKDMFNIVGYNLPPINNESISRLSNPNYYNFSFDSRLYTELLTRRDKIKHMKYQKLYKSEYLDSKIITNQQNNHDNNKTTNNEEALSWQDESSNNKISQTTNTNIDNKSGDNDLVQSDAEGSLQKVPNNNGDTGASILTDLSQNDVRVLMLSEDELTRCGNFERVFPSPTSTNYLKYFDKPRYYNYLLDAWEQKYKDNRLDGIKRLSNLANFLN